MKEKVLKIIRYILILATVASALINNSDIDTKGLILLLLIITLVQISSFTFKNERFKYVLLMVDILLLTPIAKTLNPAIFTISAIVVMEIAFLEKRVVAYLLFSLLGIVNTYVLLNLKSEVQTNVYGLMSMVFIVIVFLLFIVFKEENDKKIEAQELYDRLRISEENLKKSNKELELYANSIEEITTLRERNRISREIHDSVGHALSTIIIQLGAIEKLSSENQVVMNMSSSLKSFTKESLDTVRSAVKDLKPDEYKNIDILIMIDNLFNQHKKMTGVEVIYSFSQNRWKLDEEQSTTIYRAIQEFIGNSNKYSKATKLYVTFIYNDDSLTITLKDNGVGTENIKLGFGLSNMRERIQELGGEMNVISKINDGFTINITIPKLRKLKVFNENKNRTIGE